MPRAAALLSTIAAAALVSTAQAGMRWSPAAAAYASDVVVYPRPADAPLGTIAFTRFVDLNGNGVVDDGAELDSTDVWVLEVTESAVTATKLAQNTDGKPDLTPSYSPDGGRLAWTAQKPSGRLGVRILTLATGTMRWLTPDINPQNERWPNWSPDGNQIVYSRKVAAGSLDVWIATVIGKTDAHKVAGVSTDVEDCCASFTPDGQRIVFASNRFKRTSKFDLFTALADHRGPEDPLQVIRLTQDPLYEGTPSVTSRGDILYRRFSDVYRLSAESGWQLSAPVITGGESRTPAASPDAQWIAYGWRPDAAAPLDILTATSLGALPANLTEGLADDASNTDPSWRGPVPAPAERGARRR